MSTLEIKALDGRTIRYQWDPELRWFVQTERGEHVVVDIRPIVGFPIMEVDYLVVRTAMLVGDRDNPLPRITQTALSSGEYWAGRAVDMVAAAVELGDLWPMQVRSAMQIAEHNTGLSQELRHRIQRVVITLVG